MYEPVETTTTCADELDAEEEDADEEEAEAPDRPVDALLPPNELPADDDPLPLLEAEDEPDEVPDAVTCWPAARLSDATVPLMVDTSVASASEVCALVTCVSAEAIWAWSEAIWADEASSV
jgi:hypothetical protein